MKDKIYKFIEHITGDTDEMKSRYLKLSGRDRSQDVLERKNEMLKTYLVVLGLSFLLLSVFTVSMVIDRNALETRNGRVIAIERADNSVSTFNLKAYVEGEEEDITVSIGPKDEDGEPLPEEDSTDELKEEQSLSNLIAEVIRKIEDDPAKNRIRLPEVLSDGRSITFGIKRDFTWIYFLIVTAAILFWVYKTRFSKLEKEEKDSQDSVIMELPQFINKLTLLLGGGIVLTDAVGRIISEYVEIDEEENYFYMRLADIKRVVEGTNSSYEKELSKFAMDTGINEFIRVANVLTDSIEKGSGLVDKLEAESKFLWFSRKKKAEEKGQAADTKMTLPLVMILLSLVIITMAPAMLVM